MVLCLPQASARWPRPSVSWVFAGTATMPAIIMCSTAYAQPRRVVAPSGVPGPAEVVAPTLGPWRRSLGLRYRRDPGAASEAQDQCPGHLPGCGALQPQLHGQGQRPALDFPDVAGPHTLGRAALGLAPPNSLGTLGTVLPAAGPFPQETHRLGPPGDPATAPLAAPPYPGAGRGQRLRRSGPAAPLPIVEAAGYLHNPVA